MAFKRKYKRKRAFKKKKGKQTVMRVSKSIVPDNLIVKLKYCDTTTLDSGVNSKAYDTWSCNSIFDPYTATGGHQPLGSDEWATFYSQYMVLGAKLTAIYQNHGTASTDGQIAICQTDVESTWVPTDFTTLLEQGRTRYKFLTPAGGSRDQCTINCYYSPKKIFGVKDPKDSLVLRGLTGDLGTGNSPSTQAYFHVGLAGTQQAQNAGACTVIVKIEYVVYYSGRKVLSQS